MARDPYNPCPCGSGNKLKFCCADVSVEMDKVERLLGNNQPHMALQAMEKILESHPNSQWTTVCLASTLINADEPEQAKQVLRPLLKQHPEQPVANALYALAAYNADGYPDCKRAAHRAFKQSTQALPDLVGTLTKTIAESLWNDGQVMASRQYMVIAMRLLHDEARREVFENLLELDGDTTIPYPLRGTRQPMDFDDSGAAEKPARLAARLALVGCFDEAAEVLETIAEGHPHDAALAYNIGLFRAWDGDHSAAIVAFRKASNQFDSAADAVECEVLAQCLELTDPDHRAAMRLRRFELSSVSQLLSKLDDAEQFSRVGGAEDETSAEHNAPVARYVFLNRPISEHEAYQEWTWETVPLVEGRIAIFDRDSEDEQPAQVFVIGLEGEELDRTVQSFQTVVGDLAVPTAQDEIDDPSTDVTGHVPKSELPLRWSGFIPPEAPREISHRTAQQRWDAIVEDIWPMHPLSVLGDRTPTEAAAAGDAAVALEAALVVFDAYADARDYILPVDKLRDRLSLASPEPLVVDEQTNLNSLTVLQIHRLDWSALPGTSFSRLLQRATVLRHSRLLYDALQEALNRPDETSQPQARDRILVTIAGLCGNALKRDEAYHWIEKGRQHAADSDNAFESLLEWKMRELTLRIECPDDPQLKDLLDDLWHHYGAKLPQLREYLVTLVEAASVTAPWETAILTPGVSSTNADPWSPAEQSGGEKTLWLPGSD